MPYKSESHNLPSKMMDKRIKLLDCQREMILYWTKEGMSQRALARMFNVSRRTITFIQDPEKLAKNKQARLERGGSQQYYDKDKHAEYVRNHRKSKHERMQGFLNNK